MSARTHSGLSHEEIGKILGCSRQNVQLIERRALNKLRAVLGSSYRGKWLPYDTEGVPDCQPESVRARRQMAEFRSK